MQYVQCAPVAFAQHQNVVPFRETGLQCAQTYFCLRKHIVSQLGLGGFKISVLEP